MDVPESDPNIHLQRGTHEYRRLSRAIFATGFMTFAMLYVVQGIMPNISRDFSVSPAEASLTLSLTTLPLAIAVIVAASWSEGRGRRRLLITAVLSAAALTLATSIAPNFASLLALRMLTGLVLGALPAVAMAYIAEEFHPSSLGVAMGFYISGTGVGGMTGRILGGFLAGIWNWRVAMAVVGGLCFIGGMMEVTRLPPSLNFVPAPGNMRKRLIGVGSLLRDTVILRFAISGFVLMGTMVSFFNYLQFRLLRGPFHLSPTLVSLIFILYLLGLFSANWLGRKSSRRASLILSIAIMATGALLSLTAFLPGVLLGAAGVVFGFFGAHSVISGWIGVWATTQRAQSSGLYLFGYYLGSSVAGFVGGLFYVAFGWPGEVGTALVLLGIGLVVARSLPAGDGRPGPILSS
jgi:YNFM family putative membrane transporter